MQALLEMAGADPGPGAVQHPVAVGADQSEVGQSRCGGSGLFAIEFGLTRGYGGTAVTCELIDSVAGMHNTIKVANTGTLPALGISIDSTISKISWYKDTEYDPDEQGAFETLFNEQNYVPHPPYLPIRNLPSGSDVILRCWRVLGAPTQDVLQVTWKTPDGQVHRNEQSWSWTPR